FDTPEAARVARDVFRDKGETAARAVKIAHAVPWLMADGSTVPAPGRASEAPAEESAEPPAATSAEPAAAEPPKAEPATVPKAAPPQAQAPAAATAPAAPRVPPVATEEAPLIAANAGGAANWNSTLVA